MVEISGLDHLVLTVTELDRTVGFHQRVLGMRAVTFGPGRRALAFGPSKINLHQAGHELAPHAATLISERAARPRSGMRTLHGVTCTDTGIVLRTAGSVPNVMSKVTAVAAFTRSGAR